MTGVEPPSAGGAAFALGYGTNGFANHRLGDALRVIADLGYEAVALTLDHQHLDPFAPDLGARVDRVAATLADLGLRVVVETGARYLLDPWRKHHPTLVSPDAAPRVDFLRRALRVAEGLGADCVSCWSGVAEPGTGEREPTDEEEPASRGAAAPGDLAWRRLRDNLRPVLAEAERRSTPLALEPEPGHRVWNLRQALDLRTALGEPEWLRLTLDVGHCVAVEADTAADCVRRAGTLLANVQLDDMLPGVHEHLEFGEGQLDLPATLAALVEVGYTGIAAVELPRHSHAAPDTARRALTALTAALPTSDGRSEQDRREFTDGRST